MSTFRAWVITMLFVAGSLSLNSSLSAQTETTGDVVGTVTDSSGAVVPGITVTLRNIDTNEVRTELTKSAGEYRFSLLKPGEYEISAEHGSLKSSIEKFSVLLGEVEKMNLQVNVQGTQQIVQVTTETTALQTENANLTSSFNTQQVNDLPASGGDITTVAFTVPGVRVNVGGGSGNFNANGVPGVSNLFTLDGADYMDPYNNLNDSGASNNTLGQNQISEAAVVLNAYSPQYGRMAGAQVNWISKSGTNSFHGNLFYDYNGDIMNANDFFKNAAGAPRPRSDANQFGASLGGPIWKNKTFFFVDYESLRYVLPASGIVSIPSPQFQNYTLAHIPAADVALYKQLFGLFNSAPGVGNAVSVTNGNGPLQDANGHLGCGNATFPGTVYQGNQIFGVNTACADAFETNVNELNNESYFTARVDHSLTDQQKLSFRYTYDWGLQATGPSVINPIFNSQSTQPQDLGALTYTYVITPNLVNNFIGSVLWYSAIFGVADFSKAESTLPVRFLFDDGGANGSQQTAGDYLGPVGATIPYGRNVGQGQLVDDLSWTLGKHSLKAGVNYRYDKVTDTQIASNSIVGTYTIYDLTDFATAQVNSTGYGTNFSQSYPLLDAAHIRLYSLGFYAMDEWAATKNLKLTYGIRFERDENPYCVDNCFSRLNTPIDTPGYSASITTPYNQSVTSGLSTEYPGLEAIIPEPRFGMVWAPFGPEKTTIRGGIGLFASLFAASTAENVFDNAPDKFTPTVQLGTIGTASADPNSAQAVANASAAAFENGFKNGYTVAQIQAALGSVHYALPNFYSVPQTFHAPKVTEWSFEIEQPLSHNNVFAVTYAGNHGYDELLTNADANAFLKTPNKYYPNGFGGLPTAPPDPRFLTVYQYLPVGISNYDGLTTELRHAFSMGFQGQIGYTWSHALGDTGTGSTQTMYNPYLAGNYGSLPFDTRQALTGDIVWNTPGKFSNKFLNNIIGGWTLGAKLYLYSGRPFSVTNSQMNARLNSTGGLANNFLADLIVPSAINTVCGANAVNVKCLTSSDFAVTPSSATTPNAQFNFGNISPNSFVGPGYFDIDSQLTKTIRIKERVGFTFGAQAYNLTNHVNFATPSGSVTSSGLGLITSDVLPPTSIYGSGEGAAVSGRVLVITSKLTF